MKRALSAFLILLSLHAAAQTPNTEGSLVNWMSLKEAMEKEKTQPKPIILDFYTDWCGWCKHMMKTTYANPDLAQYINNNFYPAKFDAEGKDTIEYLGKKYYPTSKDPRTPHELAVELLQGKLMYPTTLFLAGYDKEKNKFNINMLAAGYLDQQKIEPILVYIVENVYRNATLDDFRNRYQQSFYDSTNAKRMEQVKRLTPKEAFNAPLPKKKKTLVVMHTNWCNACKVMRFSTFSDSSVVDYLNKKFELVDFDVETTDTLMYKGLTMTNPKTQQVPFNQLAFALGRGSLTLPTLVVLDEYMDVIDAIPSYISPSFLNDIMHYYGEGINKTKSWKEYMESKN
jgi:thioredoxin-related protein